jgi:hypothetical protein
MRNLSLRHEPVDVTASIADVACDGRPDLLKTEKLGHDRGDLNVPLPELIVLAHQAPQWCTLNPDLFRILLVK